MDLWDITREGKTLAKAYGQITDGEVNINMSSIYTVLIQMAGRWCEYYASDILYEVKHIKEHIESMEFPDNMLIGFRKMGVDNTAMMEARTKIAPNEYIKILKLFFDKTEDNLTVQLIEMN